MRLLGNSFGVWCCDVSAVAPVKTGGYLRETPPGFNMMLSLVFVILNRTLHSENEALLREHGVVVDDRYMF
ncbi:MAG: hypothetical protein IPH20_18135 [Bacteroidales bacterium]|nr:hypothetical protein [Bacteroidales bacterium]